MKKSGREVCELFAGVGGFRLGLEKSGWEVVWSNQWEPGKRKQHASDCYVSHFGEAGHANTDIATIEAADIPYHRLLVGGFPCQDYSVAATNAKGIQGKKGVLWWEINRIIREKLPDLVLLENVDRLLKSPASQRGRDFGIMLGCFRDLKTEDGSGYSVEWRVINAADYGFPQKRRRVFILAFREDTGLGSRLSRTTDWHSWLVNDGFFARAFPVHSHPYTPEAEEDITHGLEGDLVELSERFAFPFQNSGVMSEGRFYTLHLQPKKEMVAPLEGNLDRDIPEQYYITDEALDAWRYAKGAKAEKRCTSEGYAYEYKEGAIPFPDELSEPARTILTSEGGRSPNRCSHVVEDPESHAYRRLTPLEVERVCGFPDGWTDTGMPESWRYFCMGNSLVVGLIERMGRYLAEEH